MKLVRFTFLFAAYIVLPVALAHAHPKPPKPVTCSACGLKAPEFDLAEIISGATLVVGAALLFVDRFRRKR